MSEFQHYFMVAGEVVFQRTEDEPPMSVRLNTVVMSKTGQFPLTQIARAQQTLQMQFHKRIDDPNIRVLDVVLMGIMPLGKFTPEKFNAKPEGMEMRQVEDLFKV